MNIGTCIAHAIHRDLDIVEAYPAVYDMSVEEIEVRVEEYITNLHKAIERPMIANKALIQTMTSESVAELLQPHVERFGVPREMLVKICRTTKELMSMDAKFILDTEAGGSLYFVKLKLS